MKKVSVEKTRLTMDMMDMRVFGALPLRMVETWGVSHEVLMEVGIVRISSMCNIS